MSWVRIRVARSDCGASRIAVSVTRTRVSPRIHSTTAAGPSASSSAFAPETADSGSSRGGRGLRAWAGGSGRSFTSG